MEEKTIITSESVYASGKRKKLLIILATIVVLCVAAFLIVTFVVRPNMEKGQSEFYRKHHTQEWVEGYGKYSYGRYYYYWDSDESEKEYYEKGRAISSLHTVNFVLYCVAGFSFLLFLVFLILWLKHRKEQIIVTDKRVYGKAAFGKRVDLPLDSISAIAMSKLKIVKGIAVSTASGKIAFTGIRNREDIYETIVELLIRRQDKPSALPLPDPAGDLKKFKELLDNGIITQEEFDVKKKQILEL